MDSRDLFSDQDPPAAAALYLSALDHEQHYSAAELWQAVFRAQTAAGRPAELTQLYRQSTLGADASEYDVRARRRNWALDKARHLALDDGRPADAEPPAWSAWEEPAPASSATPHTPSPSPSSSPHPAQQSYPGPRQTIALRELRAARRRPAQVAAAVVVAQMSGVVLANEAPGVMAVAWAGPVNVGLGLVLAQVAFTGWAVLWYVRYARRRLEPLVQRHRASFPHLESRP
ncbi:DUF485 domain-containing protein [Streptomyces caniscabiei]|uniref:DUF485 domain-containing protein n=1 Tax=Streptomyces caniscabiei TaxID=2746961 RepID=A0A927L793_9ACTN|nr:DUF485 domain-containing protein [Streptomyces caniscabiei]MBD9726544.1 DUF485 domain-containing protein [Streptomyces caniscabiei]MDX3511596.1 DUF485 domain-containing protein [Streptomyces caniscabiei]MDX3719145.1 DUF485 domain-containing protein [Streptomyces caniscabiei]WEO29703.1 DUF485 domain-containing protein [Streptomyces caniscabiei]